MADSPLHPMQAFMPGLQFFQQMAQPAMPSMGAPSAMTSWVTPTLDPDELDKKIQDLKTVQFWLEQNVKALAATIQAMEVQKLTLHTLRGMNVSLQEVAQSWQSAMPSMAAAADKPDPAPAPAPTASPLSENSAQAAPAEVGGVTGATPAMPPLPAGMDPMQWWGTLSQQFHTLAQAAASTLAPDAGAPTEAPAGKPAKPSRTAAAKPTPAAKSSATAAKKTGPQSSARAGTKPARKP